MRFLLYKRRKGEIGRGEKSGEGWGREGESGRGKAKTRGAESGEGKEN